MELIKQKIINVLNILYAIRLNRYYLNFVIGSS